MVEELQPGEINEHDDSKSAYFSLIWRPAVYEMILAIFDTFKNPFCAIHSTTMSFSKVIVWMVQIQSTWFPLIDRNPQKFVPSIYQAAASDFTKAAQRVYCSPAMPSHIVLPVMP